MNIADIANILSEKVKDVRRNESMAGHTSFRTGGPADIMALPRNKDEIRYILSVASENKCPLLVVGRGTNLVVTGKGIRGIVMKIADNYSGVRIDGESITAKSGTSLSTIVKEAIDHSLGGAEFLGGIPGALGGAVCMNAGAYGGEIGEFIEEVCVVSKTGEKTFRKEDMDFGYRKSILSDSSYIVTGAKFKLQKCDAESSRIKLSELNGKRRDKQPLEYPSAGSTFKRPQGYFAGTLIEQAGLKGLSIGGAQVSEKHAGFIINRGGATPEDILALIEEVQRRVKEFSGVSLEPEVKIVGER
jgi:UDP-N-acetylmuramate dehydrogenase